GPARPAPPLSRPARARRVPTAAAGCARRGTRGLSRRGRARAGVGVDITAVSAGSHRRALLRGSIRRRPAQAAGEPRHVTPVIRGLLAAIVLLGSTRDALAAAGAPDPASAAGAPPRAAPARASGAPRARVR